MAIKRRSTSDDEKRVSFKRKDLKGSRLRCLMMTSGGLEEVAGRLTRLGQPFAAVAGSQPIMPRGFLAPDEARLSEAPRLLGSAHRKALTKWWLRVERGNTPNWDIAAAGTIGNRDGLLLVEAKAHESEMEIAGKRVGEKTDRRNHERIGEAIAEASTGLNAAHPGWALSHRHHYQLSNRFAWAWKVASRGVPVVLVYLGFLDADEWKDAFKTEQQWEDCVRAGSRGVVPDDVWGREILVGGTPLVPLIRSLRIRFELPAA